MTALLDIHSLSVGIAGKQVCQALSLQIKAGESWAILGMNGVGKTTLLHTLAGLRAAQHGEILLDGSNLQQLSRRDIAMKLGLLLQDSEDAFPGTVMQTALCGRHPHMKSWQWESQTDLEIAQQALSFVGMQTFAERSILSLSGGERRRVAIATLLCQQTPLMLLDEPTNHLDLRFQHLILSGLIDLLKQQQRATLMIMHDVNLAIRYCDHALLLFNDGNHLAGRCDEIMNSENLSKLYDYPMKCINDNGETVYLPT